MLEIALTYAAVRRWQVIPLHDVATGACSCGKPDCSQGGKHPRTANGLKDATTDATVITAWWSAWPSANIGVVTGPTSGVWMLGPDGEQGKIDLAELVDQNGSIPATAKAVSGSGGLHFYFRYPADGRKIRNRRNLHGTKIDVRAHGDGPGYFVAPGSRNANGRYTWIDDCVELADAPEWLLDWAARDEVRADRPHQPPTPNIPSSPMPSLGGQWSIEDRARAYLDRCPPAVSGQRGHDALFYAARAVVYGFDLGPQTGYDLLRSHYNHRCLPPWPDSDLMRKCREADTQPFDKQRGWLLLENREREEWPVHSGAFGCAHNLLAHTPSSLNPADGTPTPPTSTPRHTGQTPPPMFGFSGPPELLPTSMPVPPFPVDVFPPAVAEFINEATESLAVPHEYVAIPVLGTLSVAIGRSRELQVKPGYYESALLFLANVAPPGAKKSPSLKAAVKPLMEAQHGWREEFKRRLEEYSVDSERHAEDHKQWKKNGCDGDPPAKPVKPVCRLAMLDDTTIEAAAKVLNDNGRGVGLVKDELTAMLGNMNAYRNGKGADREFYLSVWSGQTVQVNRAKDHDAGPLVIPHPFVAVFGMLTPGSLTSLRGDNKSGEMVADGFFERFLMSFAEPVKAVGEQWQSVSAETSDRYAAVVNALLNVELRDPGDGRRLPNLLWMSEEAKSVWEVFTTRMADAMNQLDEFDPFRGVLSKLTGYGGRLALVLWCARKASGDLPDPFTQELDADTLRRATTLIDYFVCHGRKAMGCGWKERRQRLAERIIGWLRRNPQITAFNRSMVYHAIKDRRDVTRAEAVNEPLAMLVDHLFIRPFEADGGRPGPKPENYAVNPTWVRERTAEGAPTGG